MKNIGFIPVRGGSKSIPLKNIKAINQKPLVYWCVKAACQSCLIEKVYVATDSEVIAEVINSFKKEESIFQKVEVIGRSIESATDTATTESVMLEFAEKYEFDNIILIQATSPLLLSQDLDKGIRCFLEEEVDSVLSVVPQKRFCWNVNEHGFAIPTNYDIYQRPRRQDFDGYMVENGAFYITSKKNLMETGNRISGKIKVVEMSEDTFLEIDEPEDWELVELLLKKRDNNKPDFSKVKMFLTDCDGCLTDGSMYYSEKGDELKKFHTRDGMGFQLLREKGIITGIITGEESELVVRRAKKLKLDICEVGIKDKLKVVQGLSTKYGIAMENILYIGDDINDISILKVVGVPCCVNDAISSVKSLGCFITKQKGGEGAIREVVDEIIKYR